MTDLMSGRGGKKSGIKSPVADTMKAGMRGKKSMKMLSKRKMKGRR